MVHLAVTAQPPFILLLIILRKRFYVINNSWKIQAMMMPTRVIVDSKLCGFETVVTVTKQGQSTRVRLESGCSKIKDYGGKLSEVKKEDLYRAETSQIFSRARETRLTPTCIVPVAVMNACWIENQLISKNLALSNKELKIIFDE